MPRNGRFGGLRDVAELAALVALVTADLWLLEGRPVLVRAARVLAAGVVLGSIWRRRSWHTASVGNARRAYIEAGAATLLLTALIVLLGLVVREPYDELDLDFLALPPAAMALWFFGRLLLAVMQQVGLHLFLRPLAHRILGRETVVVVPAVAILFGLLHLPNLFLAAITALGGWLWMVLYGRGGRLLPLVLSHALLVIATSSVLPQRLVYDFYVGSRAAESMARSELLDRADVRALLRSITSPGYFEHHGGSLGGWIGGLYKDCFGRAAAPEEREFWTRRTRRGSRLLTAKLMMFSEELDLASLPGRRLDYGPMKPGLTIDADGASTRFDGWTPPSGGWRWAATSASVRFRLDVEGARAYSLELRYAARRSPGAELFVNDRAMGMALVHGPSTQVRRFIVAPGLLEPDRENEVRLVPLPAPAGVVAAGPAFGLQRIGLQALRFPSVSVTYLDDVYFLEGFSIAESGARWTDGPVGRVAYPLDGVDPDTVYTLELFAGAHGRQEVEVLVNGHAVEPWVFEGTQQVIRKARLESPWLRDGSNEIEFRLPGAKASESDNRRLGIALVWIRIRGAPNAPRGHARTG